MMEEWNKGLKARREGELRRRRESAEQLHHFRNRKDAIADDYQRLAAARREETRRKHQDAEAYLHRYRSPDSAAATAGAAGKHITNLSGTGGSDHSRSNPPSLPARPEDPHLHHVEPNRQKRQSFLERLSRFSMQMLGDDSMMDSESIASESAVSGNNDNVAAAYYAAALRPSSDKRGSRSSSKIPVLVEPEIPSFITVLAVSTMPNVKQAIDLFVQYDVNRNFTLSFGELSQVWSILFHDLENKPATVMKAYHAADKNADGFVKFDEYEAFLLYNVYHDHYFHAFSKPDANGDTQHATLLKKEEFITIAARLNVTDPDAAFAAMDANQSGALSYEEFCSWMAQNTRQWQADGLQRALKYRVRAKDSGYDSDIVYSASSSLALDDSTGDHHPDDDGDNDDDDDDHRNSDNDEPLESVDSLAAEQPTTPTSNHRLTPARVKLDPNAILADEAKQLRGNTSKGGLYDDMDQSNGEYMEPSHHGDEDAAMNVKDEVDEIQLNQTMESVVSLLTEPSPAPIRARSLMVHDGQPNINKVNIKSDDHDDDHDSHAPVLKSRSLNFDTTSPRKITATTTKSRTIPRSGEFVKRGPRFPCSTLIVIALLCFVMGAIAGFFFLYYTWYSQCTELLLQTSAAENQSEWNGTADVNDHLHRNGIGQSIHTQARESFLQHAMIPGVAYRHAAVPHVEQQNDEDDRLQRRLEDNEIELKKLEEAVQQREEEIRLVKKREVEVLARVSKLEEEMKQNEKAIKGSNEAQLMAESEVSKLKAKNEELTATIKNKESDNSRIASHLDRLSAQNVALLKKRDETLSLLNKTTTVKDEFSQEIQTMKEELNRLREAAKLANAQVEQVKKEAASTQRTIKRELLLDYSNKMEQCNVSISKYEEDLAKLTSAVSKKTKAQCIAEMGEPPYQVRLDLDIARMKNIKNSTMVMEFGSLEEMPETVWTFLKSVKSGQLAGTSIGPMSHRSKQGSAKTSTGPIPMVLAGGDQPRSSKRGMEAGAPVVLHEVAPSLRCADRAVGLDSQTGGFFIYLGGEAIESSCPGKVIEGDDILEKLEEMANTKEKVSVRAAHVIPMKPPTALPHRELNARTALSDGGKNPVLAVRAEFGPDLLKTRLLELVTVI